VLLSRSDYCQRGTTPARFQGSQLGGRLGWMLYVVHAKGQAFCRNGVFCDATTKHKLNTAEYERPDSVGVPGCRCAAVQLPIARARARVRVIEGGVGCPPGLTRGRGRGQQLDTEVQVQDGCVQVEEPECNVDGCSVASSNVCVNIWRQGSFMRIFVKDVRNCEWRLDG
jgi:hypothetical protein